MTDCTNPTMAALFPDVFGLDEADRSLIHRGNVLAIGTYVMTMDGLLPVEYLAAGDRIITRGGMRVLRDVDTPAPHCFALIFDAPQVIYADGEEILIDA